MANYRFFSQRQLCGPKLFDSNPPLQLERRTDTKSAAVIWTENAIVGLKVSAMLKKNHVLPLVFENYAILQNNFKLVGSLQLHPFSAMFLLAHT